MHTVKQPDEELGYTYEFGPSLNGVAISTIDSVSNVSRNGSAVLAELARGIVGSSVVVRWGGGTDGDSYLTTVRVTDAGGAQHVIDGEIAVHAHGFIVPKDVTTPYLTGEEYVERYTVEETVRLTDETRMGTIDEDKLRRALEDASAFANGYVGVKYPVPLAAAPESLKGIVAALARENLHKTRPLPAVTEAADRARAQLRDISAGRMTLLLPDNSVPEVSQSRGFAAWGRSADAVVFNSEKLDRF